MKTKVIWALVALNVLLLVGLLFPVFPAQPARAQVGAVRVRDMLMIPGDIIGGPGNSLVWVIDTGNQRLSAMAYNPNSKDLDVMAPLDLNRVFRQ